jgi:hypothetical protein
MEELTNGNGRTNRRKMEEPKQTENGKTNTGGKREELAHAENGRTNTN